MLVPSGVLRDNWSRDEEENRGVFSDWPQLGVVAQARHPASQEVSLGNLEPVLK